MIIDGRKLASKIKKEIREKVVKLGFQPGLAVILVGDDPASKIYISSKEKACREVGFYSKKVLLPAETSQEKLIKLIKDLNKNVRIQGILVQFPLPKQLDEKQVIEAIDPNKDVDCFLPENLGQLMLKKRAVDLDNLLAPCTPKGIIRLIRSVSPSLEGKKAVVVGRSNLVGKPLAWLLLAQDATVTVCHSKTRNLALETKQADILIAAVGRTHLIKAEMVKKGAVVIDVGINRTEKGLQGDVDFARVKNKAGFITPVPGGVGPMTIASLLENTLLLAKKASK